MDFKEAIRRIFEIDGIYEKDKSKEGVFKRALITHWLQGNVPEHLLNNNDQTRWLEALGSSAAKPAITYETIPFPPPQKPKFTFIDLFAGIGGFRIAFQELSGKCVFSSEWNAPAQQTYFNNYGEYPFGDIRDFTGPSISKEELKKIIPDHDILAAGFPCQPFSHAGVSARISVGKNHGFECDTQGTLFFDICRIVDAKQPKVIFLENVQNLKRHDEGRTFRAISKAIDELGYNFYPEIVDASTMVPQRRKRCYMVCIHKNYDSTFYYPTFQQLLSQVEPISAYTSAEQVVRISYSLRCLRGFLNFMGLAEIEEVSKRSFREGFRLRKQPFLDQVVQGLETY